MARKPVTVNFEITDQSFQKLDKIMKKFNLEWDSKVYKSVGKLNSNLDLVAKRISALTVAMNKQRGGNANATGGVQFNSDKFFNELGDSMDDFTKAMKKAAEEISNLQISVKGAGSASEEEKINRMESLANADVAEGQRKVFMQKERHRYRDLEAAQDHRLKQERLFTRHLMSLFGGGAVGGGLGLIMKEITEGIGGKFTKASATQDYLKTEEGQNVLQFQKAAQGSKNPLGQFGSQISPEWADKGVTQEGLEKSGGIMGRAKSWMGRRVEGAQTGDMTKMMGGKKGMMLGAGALAGAGIMKKAISLGIESSPMMQQMLKLWKFGIMMIFRPIGDFFGFFLRPIFVMLLRKFIIPFYQEYLPLMQQMGHDLGTKIANLLTWILESPLLKGANKEDVFVKAYAEKDMSGMAEGKVFDENMSLAMQESLIQNKGYWEKFFVEAGKVPIWVKDSLPDNPEIWTAWETYIKQQNNRATGANVNVTTLFGTFTPAVDKTTTSVKNLGLSLDSLFFGKKPEGVTEGYNETSGYTDVDLNKIPDYLGGTKDTSSTSLDTSSSPAANNFYVEMNSNLIVNTPDDSTTEETIKTNQDDRDKEMKNWFKRRIANISDV